MGLRETQNKQIRTAAMAITPRATPTPMPALAPVERPDDAAALSPGAPVWVAEVGVACVAAEVIVEVTRVWRGKH